MNRISTQNVILTNLWSNLQCTAQLNKKKFGKKGKIYANSVSICEVIYSLQQLNKEILEKGKIYANSVITD